MKINEKKKEKKDKITRLTNDDINETEKKKRREIKKYKEKRINM